MLRLLSSICCVVSCYLHLHLSSFTYSTLNLSSQSIHSQLIHSRGIRLIINSSDKRPTSLSPFVVLYLMAILLACLPIPLDTSHKLFPMQHHKAVETREHSKVPEKLIQIINSNVFISYSPPPPPQNQLYD